MIILVDLDGTLMSPNRDEGHRMGPPMPGAIAAMRRLYVGNTLIVFTGRPVDGARAYLTVENWLHYFGIPYHGISNVKPDRYDLIIDNKAIHFDSWPKVLFRIDKLYEKV
jgi:hypothetical protein